MGEHHTNELNHLDVLMKTENNTIRQYTIITLKDTSRSIKSAHFFF